MPMPCFKTSAIRWICRTYQVVFWALGVSGEDVCLSVVIMLQYGVVTPALVSQARNVAFCK